MKYLLLLLVVCFSVSAFADMAYLKKDNPNELSYWAFVDEQCSISNKEVNKIVEGVLIRSRIKPGLTWYTDSVYLYIHFDCMPLENNNPVLSTTIYFGRYTPLPSIGYHHDYGNIGIGDKELQTRLIKQGVERAVTDFVRVNFLDDAN